MTVIVSVKSNEINKENKKDYQVKKHIKKISD